MPLILEFSWPRTWNQAIEYRYPGYLYCTVLARRRHLLGISDLLSQLGTCFLLLFFLGFLFLLLSFLFLLSCQPLPFFLDLPTSLFLRLLALLGLASFRFLILVFLFLLRS